jgi:transcription termination factor Rho
MNISELQEKNDHELLDIAREMGLFDNGSRPRRQTLLNKILQNMAEQNGNLVVGGILAMSNEGYGFLKPKGRAPGVSDVYVSQSQIRRFGLRTGDEVSGQVRPPKDGERYFGLVRVENVNDMDPDVARGRPHFENLTPVHPYEHIILENNRTELSTRLIDLVAPVGRGQRGMIVSPPKAGKTTLLKDIANGITANAPDIHLMVALIGERPEEVTDMMRSVQGEVYSSTFDEPVETHCQVAELVLERAKRLVEGGKDVCILLDSLTRLTRAYNLAVPSSGRTLSGGMDPIALYPPRKFFGAARKVEDGGSLTILAACLVDTGSRMDDVIYEEFKGTGNMEVHLDRKLSERRVYPAIDIPRSGTRREELLLDEMTLRQVWLLRRMVSMITTDAKLASEATEKVIERLARAKDNKEFLMNLGSSDA